MKIGSINSQFNFGRVERKTAEKLLNDAPDDYHKFYIREQIVMAEEAKDCLIQYDEDSGLYGVYLPTGRLYASHTKFANAIDCSLKHQKRLDMWKKADIFKLSQDLFLDYFTDTKK